MVILYFVLLCVINVMYMFALEQLNQYVAKCILINAVICES